MGAEGGGGSKYEMYERYRQGPARLAAVIRRRAEQCNSSQASFIVYDLSQTFRCWGRRWGEAAVGLMSLHALHPAISSACSGHSSCSWTGCQPIRRKPCSLCAHIPHKANVVQWNGDLSGLDVAEGSWCLALQIDDKWFVKLYLRLY